MEWFPVYDWRCTMKEETNKEVSKVLKEIIAFTEYSVDGEAECVEYLYTARKIANCYDKILYSCENDAQVMSEIDQIRHYLKDNPLYLSFE